MNDRQQYPDQEEVEHSGERQPAESGGAMTGATGSLTSVEFGTEPFVPGELREIEDPTRAGRMTDALARHEGHDQHAAAPGPAPSAEAAPRGPGAGHDDSDMYSEGEERL
jgi:hypothetical protein